MNFVTPLRAGLLLAALATPITAHADARWYAGAAYSRANGDFVNLDYGSRVGYGPQPDEDGFKILAGFRPMSWLSIEANYVDLGSTAGKLGFVCIDSPCPASFIADAKAFSLSTQLLYPLGPADLFARLGIARWNADYEWINDDGSSFADRDNAGTDATWGAGVQFAFRNITTRVEFERFELGDDSADTVSLGVFYRFH
jgi:opacity protein-like surface antigen